MITLADVASKAGVSRSTASCVLSDRASSIRISDVTRQRVMQSAADLGYYRNELARAVTTGKSRMIGFWVMLAGREPALRVLAGAIQEADRNDYLIKMIGLDNSDNWDRILARCLEWRLSGFIAAHAPEDALYEVTQRFGRVGMPVTCVDCVKPPAQTSHVTSDGKAGVSEMVHHLAQLGHRNIAFLGSGPDHDSLPYSRAQGYLSAMRDLGLGQFAQICSTYWRVPDAEAAVADLLLQPPALRPTALVCISDETAMTAIRTIVRLGLQVPGDVSVTGFDDLSGAALYNPSLTTVGQDFEEMGRLAVRQLLLPPSHDPADYPLWRELPTHLQIRESTAPVRINGQ